MGFLDTFKLSRLKDGLSKTRDNVIQKVTRVINASRKIDDALLDEIEEILILGDVGVSTTSKIIDQLRERVKRERYEDASELQRLLQEEIAGLFQGETVCRATTPVFPSRLPVRPVDWPCRRSIS